MGVSELVGSGCAVRSLRLARVRASGLIASLSDEAVAGVVIVCPSTRQICSYSSSKKYCGLRHAGDGGNFRGEPGPTGSPWRCE